jgi:diguanylate cyclase (GGDEF)-like protein
MTMTRRFALLMAAILLPALAGSLWIHAVAARDALQVQLEVLNQDAATALALSMSQQKGDLAAMEAVASAQFDLGHYRRMRFAGVDGQTVFDRSQPLRQPAAPAWFVAALPLSAPAGQAPVSDGWKPLGQLQVESQASWAHAALWAACARTAVLLALLAAAALALAGWLLRGWVRPLRAAVSQAQAIAAGRFMQAEEPSMPELKALTQSMNRMAGQLRQAFDEQAAQVERLQQQAQTDAVTELPVRQQFVGRLADRLADPAATGTALLLVRLLRLDSVNDRLGFDATDRLLAATAEVLRTYVQRVPGAVAGRLNGSDFGLVLPAAGVAEETAQSLHAALGASPLARAAVVRFCVGGVEALRGQTAGAALSAADAALAQAEADERPVVLPAGDRGAQTAGARAWRARMEAALDAGWVRLGEFPVVDSDGRLIHLECPLRLALDDPQAAAAQTPQDAPGGGPASDADPANPYRPAREWLAQAIRARLMPRVDLAALDLALAAIAADGQPRCVHVAQASLAEPGFVRSVEQRLAAAPAAARRLSIEWTDSPQPAPAVLLHEAAAGWRARGARLGVEHAGASAQALTQWQATPVDYVKIDARHLQGAAADQAVRGYAQSLAALVHGLGLKALAEGITDVGDLQALWALGFDGATGAAVRLRPAA